MMQTGLYFPWPMLIVPMLIGVTIVFFMATRMHRDHIGIGIGRGNGTHRQYDQQPRNMPREDPIVILRERFASGDIAIEEFKLRVDELLRSEQVK